MTTTVPSATLPASWKTWHGYAPLEAGIRPRIAAASGDLVEGVRRWRLWGYLAMDDIKNQYRRTVIGPWWLTLQTLIHIAGLTLLFSTLFQRSIQDFLPHVGVGLVVFSFLAGVTRAGAA